MGFNMNYSVVSESSNPRYKLNNYIANYETPRWMVYSEEAAALALNEFNQAMRESRYILDNLGSENVLNESFSDVVHNIIEGIKKAIRKVRDAIVNIFKAIAGFIKKIIAAIKEKLSKKKEDPVVKKYPLPRRLELLKKAIIAYPSELDVHITDIRPTVDLLDPNFPDSKIIGDNLVKSAIDQAEGMTMRASTGDGDANRLGVEEINNASFVDLMEEKRMDLLTKVFGKYSFDSTNVIKSATEVSDVAFGSPDPANRKLTIDLYTQAWDNVSKGKETVDMFDKIFKEFESNYNNLERRIGDLNKQIDVINKAYTEECKYSGERNLYEQIAKRVAAQVSKIINVIQNVINADYNLLNNKLTRIYDLFGPTGSSSRVCSKAHALITKYINADYPNEAADLEINDTVNGLDLIEEAQRFQDSINARLLLIEDFYREESYSDSLKTFILNEEETTAPAQSATQTATPAAQAAPAADQSASSQTPTATTENPQQNTTQTKKGGVDIKAWLDKMMQNLTEVFNKFKIRFKDFFVAKDLNWWNKNKDRIAKNNLTDTTVEDWYNFNLDAFAKQNTYIKFDNPNNPIFNEDKSMEDAILKQISGGTLPDSKEGDTLSKKVIRIYNGTFVKGPTKLSDLQGFDKNRIIDFIEDFLVKGFGGTSLGSIATDMEQINADHKYVKANYDKYEKEYHPDQSNTTQQPTNTEPAKAATPQGGNPDASAQTQETKASGESAIDDDGFERFSIAEYFCLPQNEASFTPGATDKNTAGIEGQATSKAHNKELDARIKRCFSMNISAATAKMTAAISAYKQYIGLFKAVYSNKKATTDNGAGTNAQAQQKPAEAPKAEEKK